jgi:hypothetical protein
VSHIHTRQSSHCTALSIPDLTRFFGYRCEQEAEQLPPPAACPSVDQLVQLATDTGSPQLTVVRDARKVPEVLPDRAGSSSSLMPFTDNDQAGCALPAGRQGCTTLVVFSMLV